MKLKVLDIPEDGMNVEAVAAEEPWFAAVVKEAFGEDYPAGSRTRLDLHVLRTSDNVQLSGTAEVDLRPSCDRCMEPFGRHVAVPLHVNMAPHKQMHFRKEDDEEGLSDDDVAFSFYKGEEIDLSEIIREMLVLDIPLRYLCSETCKGLCARCGQNLNQAECACEKTSSDPRFAVLKELLKS